MIDSYIALDLETTGLSPSEDRILEIGAVKVKDGSICERYETLVMMRWQLRERTQGQP